MSDFAHLTYMNVQILEVYTNSFAPLPYISKDVQISLAPYDGEELDFLNTSSAEYAVGYALSDARVRAARAFEYDGELIMALLLEPMYLKSERDALKAEFERKLSERLDMSVKITFDMEVYRKISEQMSEGEMQYLCALVK